ncbi:copper-binding protein [Allohahella sp. A8]|uniref:copper-binding protein n=1 Tax=Allohahella sp. A8 TaxID=3141461 RepID=UPI003A7F6FB7
MKNLFAVTALGVAAFFGNVDRDFSIISPVYAEQAQETHQTTGLVKNVKQDKGRITLAHEPVPSLKWPSMTMGFVVEDQALLENIKPDEKVEFTFMKGEGGRFIITEISAI